MGHVREQVAWFVLCATFAAGPSWAQTPARPSAAPTASAPASSAAAPASLGATLTGEAKAEYDAAGLVFGDGDYAGAVLKFERAYELSKDARLLWNMAVCEKNLRHYTKVVQLVRRYQSEAKALMSEQDRVDAADLATAAASFVSQLKVTVDPAGAEIAIDDQMVGTAPVAQPLMVDIGERKLRVSKAGYVEHVQTIRLSGKTSIEVSIKLEPEVHEGRVNVATDPGASIYVDGKAVGAERWTGALSAGGHTLRIQAPGKRAYQGEVIVREKETREVHITLDPEVALSSSSTKWLWIAGGALVLGGASVGTYFLLKPKNEPAEISPGSMTPGNVQMPLVGWR